LVSADGKSSRLISSENPLIQTWSRDSKTVYEVKRSSTQVQLVAFDLATNTEKKLNDLESFWDIAGASLSPDGKSITTSISRINSDIWLLQGFQKQAGFFDRMFRK
ncbi:MAG TPA: hypothetical protein VLR94_03600, partial [Acidobacteriota bacterium]|nr:hypothetical protein [Acidobacteriota bacterium]